MIAVIDYGMGNLRSVQKALEYLGYDARITDRKDELADASHIVLPGVGAISDAVARLKEKQLDQEIKRQVKTGKPFLGICLGMQLLFDVSYENGAHECLGLIDGSVRPFSFADASLKVPHMGWNSLIIRDNALFQNTPKEQFVYFVHSYHADDVPEKYVTARCHYGYDFVCAVQRDNLYGVQFHPEKSGTAGLDILKNFGGLQ